MPPVDLYRDDAVFLMGILRAWVDEHEAADDEGPDVERGRVILERWSVARILWDEEGARAIARGRRRLPKVNGAVLK
jgi:hypothetical protein